MRQSDGSAIRRLAVTWLLPRWGEVAGSLVCAVVVAAATGASIWILDPVLKSVFGPHRPVFEAVLWVPAALVVVGLIRAAAQIGQASLVNRVGHSIVGDIQRSLFARLIRADLARLDEQHSGAYLSQVLYDATLIREGLTTGVVNYTQNALQVAAMFVVMLSEDWLLTTVVLGGAPVAALGPVMGPAMPSFTCAWAAPARPMPAARTRPDNQSLLIRFSIKTRTTRSP